MQPQAALGSDQTFSLVVPWFSSHLGYHTLSLVAIDDLSRPSDPAQVTVFVRPFHQVSTITIVAPETQPPGEVPPLNQPPGEADPQTPSSPGGTTAPPSGASASPGGDSSSSQGGQSPGQGASHGNPDAPEGGQAPNPGQDGQPPPGVDLMLEEGLNPEEDFIPIGDNPPEIVAFETPFTRQGQAISVNALVQALDDVAMGDVAILVQQVGNPGGFEMNRNGCPGELGCSVELNASLSAGSWVFAAQAYDAIGQASEISLRVFQVIPDPGGQAPAVVVGGLELLDLADADLALLMGDAPLDLQSLASFLMQLNRLEEISASGDEGCLTVSGQFQPEGVRLMLQINCAYGAAEGKHIFIRATRTAGRGIHLQLHPWEDSLWNPAPRTRLQVGETLENLDTSATDCGLQFDYIFQVGQTFYDPGRDEYNLTTFQTLGLPARITVPTPDCAADSGNLDEAISFDAIPNDQGVQVSWSFAEAGDWVNLLPAPPEKTTVLVARYLPSRLGYKILPGVRQFSADELPGQSDQVADDVLRQFCGEPLVYTLFVQNGSPNDASRVYAQKSVSLEPLPCPAQSLRNLELTITPEWRWTVSGHQLFALVKMRLERDFTWPETGTLLDFTVWRQGDDNEFRFADLTITPALRQSGYTLIESLGREARIQCGGVLHSFTLMARMPDGSFIDRGRVFPWVCPPRPPPPPPGG
jgi:hypothetical protein